MALLSLWQKESTMAHRLLEFGPSSLFGEEAIMTHLTAREEISRPFDCMLSIVSAKTDLKPEQVIGQPLTVRIDRGEDQPPRFFHGYISSFWVGVFRKSQGLDVPYRDYRIRLVPWTWFMTRAARCFVYLPEKAEKSIHDILDALIKRVKSYGHVDPVIESGNAKILKSRKVEHCVQYRETDFNFLSRTLEHYGVFYYFKHTENSHTLILSDQNNYPSAPESLVRYPGVSAHGLAEDVISAWEHSYEFVSGKWEHTDYDFINPSTSLKVSAQKHPSIPLKNNTAYELYDYPGQYFQKDEGKSDASIRLEAEECRFDVVAGSSTCKTFSPGYVFKLSEHPTNEEEINKAYLITTVQHVASQQGPFSTSTEYEGYSNSFTCIPRDGQFRPLRTTPRPVLSSVQTAVVVGPSGEEIYTDEYGRIKVQFHWDREGKKDENTSCWMRVCQVHAGKGFGGIDIPRVGEEVVVSFLEGDIDRPLVTGRVYHKESMPPFGLPAAKTVSGIKTKTYKGKGHNEMSMDDTPGKEKIHIHAQYDMDTKVLHDDTQTIINNRTIKVDGTQSETVKGAVTEVYQATQTTTVQTSIDIKTNKSHIRIESPTEIKLTVGSSSITLVPDTITLNSPNIIIEGTTQIKASSPKITLAADSEAVMSAPDVKVSGTKETTVGVGSQTMKCDTSKVAVAGAAISSSATGQHDITGAVVKIN